MDFLVWAHHRELMKHRVALAFLANVLLAQLNAVPLDRALMENVVTAIVEKAEASFDAVQDSHEKEMERAADNAFIRRFAPTVPAVPAVPAVVPSPAVPAAPAVVAPAPAVPAASDYDPVFIVAVRDDTVAFQLSDRQVERELQAMARDGPRTLRDFRTLDDNGHADVYF